VLACSDERDRDAFRRAVVDAVTERFLCDAKETHRDIRVKVRELAVRRESHFQTVPLSNFRAVRPERGGQAHQTQRGRMQLVRETPETVEHRGRLVLNV